MEDLAAKMRLLLEQPELRRRLAERGRRRVLAHYTQRALAEAYYEIYREMRAGRERA